MWKTVVASLLVSFALGLVSAGAQTTFFDWDGDPLPKVQLKTVAYRGWLPPGDTSINGVLVLIPGRHGDGRGMAGDARWQKLATDVRFAILACQFANGEPFPYQGDTDGEVSDSINKALEELAKQSSHPELEKAPLAFWGISAGSNVSARYSSRFPRRVVAFASSTGTSGPGSDLDREKEEVPMCFAIGKNDKPDWVKYSVDSVNAGIKKHAPWTLALHPSAGHGTGKSLDLIIPWLTAVIKERLDIREDGGAAERQKPERIDLQKGWLGNRDTYEIAAYSDYHDSKRDAIWLPNETVAKAWQDYLRN